MKLGNAAFELAEFRVEQERDAGIARAAAIVQRFGRASCRDCGQTIGDARRRAAPFAERCIGCERIRERLSRRRA